MWVPWVPRAGVQGQEGRHTDTLTGVLVRAEPQQNSDDFLGMTDLQQESVLEMWARKTQRSARMKYILYSEINLLFAFQLGLRVALGYLSGSIHTTGTAPQQHSLASHCSRITEVALKSESEL